jgi:hypothetical protein
MLVLSQIYTLLSFRPGFRVKPGVKIKLGVSVKLKPGITLIQAHGFKGRN